jgi:hypothetical protein
VGSGLQSICIGFLVPEAAGGPGQTVPLFGFTRSWQWWPVFIIPFAIFGGAIAIWIWNELPAATRKYIAEREKNRA